MWIFVCLPGLFESMELAEDVFLLLLIYFLLFRSSLAPSLGRSHPFHRRLELCCVAAPHRPAERGTWSSSELTQSPDQSLVIFLSQCFLCPACQKAGSRFRLLQIFWSLKMLVGFLGTLPGVWLLSPVLQVEFEPGGWKNCKSYCCWAPRLLWRRERVAVTCCLQLGVLGRWALAVIFTWYKISNVKIRTRLS